MPLRLTPLNAIALAAAGVGAFALAARFGASDRGDEIVAAAAPRAAQRTEIALADPPPRAALPERAPLDVQVRADPFAGSPPPPPPAPPPTPPPKPAPPPPPPAAPPLPFCFVGMLEQKSARPTAFLAKGEALHIVAVGDVIDGTYRIESLSPTQIVVTYLPLNQRQTLSPAGGQP
jgi:hypothetical protein